MGRAGSGTGKKKRSRVITWMWLCSTAQAVYLAEGMVYLSMAFWIGFIEGWKIVKCVNEKLLYNTVAEKPKCTKMRKSTLLACWVYKTEREIAAQKFEAAIMSGFLCNMQVGPGALSGARATQLLHKRTCEISVTVVGQ